jgi:hypothetical protein
MMHVRGRVPRLLLGLVLPVAVGGCAFNLACDLFGSLLQAQKPLLDVCGAFNGECCGDQDGDGLPDECSGFLGLPPCARFDTGSCFCTAGGDFAAIGQTLLPEPAAYSLPPGAEFFIGAPFAGLTGPHRAFFDTQAQDLQTRDAVITYPAAFGFNGFLALGPAETVIGALGVDFDFDFEPDLTLPLRGLTAETAYVDGNASGGFDASDPLLVHGGAHVFTLALPRGGDGLARTKVGRMALRFAFALYGGILVNPAAGTYALGGTFTSVDPDSGDGDDAQGTAPTSFPAAFDDVEIFAPPFGSLSPFLCYATKPTKGTLCGGTAAANAGGACTTDADCGGTAGACVKTPLAKGLTVDVDGVDFVVKKPVDLCTPAAIDGVTPPADQDAHLRGYQIKAAKGQPAFAPIAAMPLVNELGAVVVATTKADRVRLTSAKSLGAPPDGLVATTVEHFQCDKVKVLKKRCLENPFRKCKKSADCGVDGPCFTGPPKNATVQVGDQFTTFATPRTLKVGKPTRFCRAVQLNGDPVNEFQGMLCYAVKPGAGVAKHQKIVGQIHTANVLARERADTTKEEEICVPSVPTGVS